MSERVEIWTDGACSGNPGPADGARSSCSASGKRSSRAGSLSPRTIAWNLTAAIAALEALKRPCSVDLHTDSQYLREGITKWLAGWKKRNWLTAEKKPVKNVDLWQRLEAAAEKHDIHWKWVRGHAGDVRNERADELARVAMQPYRRSRSAS